MLMNYLHIFSSLKVYLQKIYILQINFEEFGSCRKWELIISVRHENETNARNTKNYSSFITFQYH